TARSLPLSDCVPPSSVEYSSVDPDALTSQMKTSATPLNERSAASGVVGKSAELVPPVSQALPAPSTSTALAPSPDVPPRTVEYTSADPAAFSFERNASLPSGLLSN